MTPVEVEQAVWRAARRAFGAATNRRGEIVEAALALSRAYNAEQRLDRAHATRPAARLARLVFFAIADLPKTATPVGELRARGELASSPRILDVGAGCGASTLGALISLDAPPLALDVLDADGAMLELFALVAAEVGLPPPRPLVADAGRGLPDAAAGPYDLILAGQLLAELPAEQRAPLCRALLDRLAPRGHLLLVEPGLRVAARALHALRDELCAAGAAIFAPCTRHGPCPALCRADDWCHERSLPSLPPELRALAGAARLRRRDAVWSYLTLNRHDARQAPRPGAWRVVSDPLPAKGKHEHFLCGEAGRPRATLLARHRTPANAAFAGLARGQIVWLEGDGEAAPQPRADGSLRLGPATRVVVGP